jgi:hypothetical protein
MEHLLKIVEALLAVFGSMKFLHEVYEVVHHFAKIARKFK